MVRVETAGNMSMVGKDTLMCAKTEFTQATDAPDGTTLIVIDTASHAMDSTYIAFEGMWNEV